MTAKGRADELLAMLPSIVGTDLEADPEIQALFLDLSRFSPEQLAKLIAGWPMQQPSVARYLATQDRPGLFMEVLAKLPASGDSREALLSQAGKRAAWFDPDQIGETLSGLPKGELQGVALGILARVAALKDDPVKKGETIDAYLKVVHDPAIAGVLVSQRIGVMNLSDASSWLLSMDPSVASGGDAAMLAKVKPGEVDAAADFVNALLDQGQEARARAAMESFVSGYSKHDPEGALKWVTSMPSSLASNQAITNAFSRIYQADPKRAREIMKETSDPKLLKIYERNAAVLDGQRKLLEERGRMKK